MTSLPSAPRSRSGSALLIVLGVVAVLSILVAGFGRGIRADLSATDVFYQQARNEQLARSALAVAGIERSKKGAVLYADATGNVFFVSSDSAFEREIAELSRYRRGVPLGRGYLSYRFVMKTGALDVNGLSAAAWSRLLEVACGLQEGDEGSALVDAIQDWMDADSLPRANGAEEDAYLALDPPRHCRNGLFASVEELLLVKGITRELLYGDGLPARVEDGILRGGGLYRFFVGDNSAEARASIQYVLKGSMPGDDQPPAGVEQDEETRTSEFEKVTVLPPVLYLIAEGFLPRADDERDRPDVSSPPPPDAGEAASRHILLAKLVLQANTGASGYTLSEVTGDASGELLRQVLAHGPPEESDDDKN